MYFTIYNIIMNLIDFIANIKILYYDFDKYIKNKKFPINFKAFLKKINNISFYMFYIYKFNIYIYFFHENR